jgi:hypothetical protein
MLNYLVDYISEYYNWLNEYTKMVVYEYDKFMEIVNSTNNLRLIPPDDIEKCWQAHILDTELYYKYCIEKFGRMIHYKPILDHINKRENIQKTYKLYLEKYGNTKNKIIWTLSDFSTKIKHNLVPIIKINLYKKSGDFIKYFNYYPNSVDQFDVIINLISLRYNIQVKYIKIYIDKTNTNEFNIKQINEFYKLKEGYDINTNLNIINFVNYNIINYFAILIDR